MRGFGLKLLCQSCNVPIKSKFDEVTLLNYLDLDRDGRLTLEELTYWYAAEEEIGTDAGDDEEGGRVAGADAEYGTPGARLARAPEGRTDSWQDVSLAGR